MHKSITISSILSSFAFFHRSAYLFTHSTHYKSSAIGALHFIISQSIALTTTTEALFYDSLQVLQDVIHNPHQDWRRVLSNPIQPLPHDAQTTTQDSGVETPNHNTFEQQCAVRGMAYYVSVPVRALCFGRIFRTPAAEGVPKEGQTPTILTNVSRVGMEVELKSQAKPRIVSSVCIWSCVVCVVLIYGPNYR